jgi:hypothetical protein
MSCVGRTRCEEFPGPLAPSRSDRQGELSEGSRQPSVCRRFDAQFVVAPAQVLCRFILRVSPIRLATNATVPCHVLPVTPRSALGLPGNVEPVSGNVDRMCTDPLRVRKTD